MACCAGKEIQQVSCNAPIISVVFLLPYYLLLYMIFDALPNHLKTYSSQKSVLLDLSPFFVHCTWC
jgi:hypothetical protein